MGTGVRPRTEELPLPANPFEPLYADCNRGSNTTQYESLPAFPTHIDIELASFCNFRCVFCPTGLLATGRPAELMTEQTFNKIVADCWSHKTAIRFIGWGEPCLHPKLVDFIALANGVGLLTHLNTNASKLTSELATRLVRAGLSSIKFSFQGIDRETYAEMRQTDFFEGMVRAILEMQAARGTNALPYIAASTSITDETPEQAEAFRARLEPLVDHLSIGRTVFDFINPAAIRLKPEQRAVFERVRQLESGAKQHPQPCPEVYRKLSISANGQVRVCCNDSSAETNLGNVNDRPLAEIWRDNVIEMYRKTLAKDDYSLPLCKTCFSYMDLTPGATP